MCIVNAICGTREATLFTGPLKPRGALQSLVTGGGGGGGGWGGGGGGGGGGGKLPILGSKVTGKKVTEGKSQTKKSQKRSHNTFSLPSSCLNVCSNRCSSVFLPSLLSAQVPQAFGWAGLYCPVTYVLSK